MVSRCNAADDRPAARPEGAPQAARLRVTALVKGTTLPCAPCLDPNCLWGSAYGLIYEGISSIKKAAGISPGGQFGLQQSN